jgi:FeS assembly SUF system protein
MSEQKVTPEYLEAEIKLKLQSVYDPEIPVNIFELGLIYEVKVYEDFRAYIKMTLTSPHCPAAESLPGEVESKVGAIPGIKGVQVDVVWDPPWEPDMMSEVAKLELGM